MFLYQLINKRKHFLNIIFVGYQGMVRISNSKGLKGLVNNPRALTDILPKVSP